MLRLTLTLSSLLAYGVAVALLYPRIGTTVGALTFVPVIVIGWLYGSRGGVVGAVILSILNATIFPNTGALGWIVPTFATLFMGAFVGYTSDLRAQLGQRQQALTELAERDHLTGLLNRAAFEGALERILSRPGVHAVMYMDLNGFKSINDTFGHATGDQLLKEVADRLTATMRTTDLIARIGGDEFVVAVPDLPARSQYATLARRLIKAMNAPIPMHGVPLPVTLSIGIAVAPDDGATADELLHAADQAMYEAKSNEKDGFGFHQPNTGEVLENPVTPFALQRAIRKNEFALVYQPLIHLPSRTVAGLEALVRWQHPELGLLTPAAFLAMAEDTALILPLGEWVVREACRQAVTWQEYGKDDLVVSVNVSAAQITQPDFLNVVQDALRESGLPSYKLELEITESTLVQDFDQVAKTVDALRRYGIRVAVDDFGSGFSSLNYLHKLKFDTLKIDRTFLLDSLAKSRETGRAGVVIRSIVQLAHSLDMTVVAEGVETAAQADFLTRAESDYAQGYFFAKPFSAEDMHAWARELCPGLRIKQPVS